MMTVNEMKNAMVTEFGFENDRTVSFFMLCEKDNINLTQLNLIYEILSR